MTSKPPEVQGPVPPGLSPCHAQEARRVLRALNWVDSYVALYSPTEAGVYVRRNQFRRPVLRFHREALEAFTSAGLLSRGASERFVLSEEGRRFLVRAAAGPDGFQAQHRLTETRRIQVEEDGSPGRVAATVTVNVGESPLGWLARRKGADGVPLITTEQYEAGERLRDDFTRGQLMARVTMDWTRPMTGDASGPRPDGLKDSALAARRRVDAAIAAVGPSLADVLIEACCYLRGLEEIERQRRWPPRTAKIVVRIALERLAHFMG